MFDATYQAASIWQLWCASKPGWTNSLAGKLASASVFEAWPRTEIFAQGSKASKVVVMKPTVHQVMQFMGPGTSDDELAFWIGGEIFKEPGAAFSNEKEQLFHVCVIPVFRRQPEGTVSPEADAVTVALQLPPGEVQWFVYAVLDHGYCDGPTGLPLFADLLRLYAEESGEVSETSPEVSHPNAALTALEKRLQQSLKPLPEAEHPNDDIFHDGLVGWSYRNGYQRHIQCDDQLMRLMRFAAEDRLGCSVDIAWLTIISASFLRMFPDLRRLDLYLIVTCRDRPGEETMVGYFSSRKLLSIELGDPSTVQLMGLVDLISTARRQRSWKRPRPFEKGGAIEVNIVSQASDGLPFGFKEVRRPRGAPSSWSRGNTSYMNLRLDQTSRDGWDFRLQSHDISWGTNWSTYYAQALGSVIVDMAVRPTGPVVPSMTKA